MNEQVLKAGEWDGNLYAVPTMLDTRYGIARKDLLAKAGFDSPPSDWDELREYAKALTVRDSKGKLTQAGLDVMTLDPRQMFEVFLFSNGGTLFNEDGTAPAFNSPEGVEALQYVVDLVREDKVEDVGYSSSDADTYPVINGRAAMMVGHNDFWVKAQESDPKVAEQLVPFMIHGTQDAMFQGGTLVTVANQSQNKDAALALLEFLTDAEASLAANEQRGNVPALGELLESDYVTSNSAVQFAMENLDNAHPEGGVPAWLEIRGDFEATIQEALLGQKSAAGGARRPGGLGPRGHGPLIPRPGLRCGASRELRATPSPRGTDDFQHYSQDGGPAAIRWPGLPAAGSTDHRRTRRPGERGAPGG